ncbi:hypothetical protein V6N11_049343 [Hibiscus sabdariffa]|uniref:Uncharacterized protein n=2 Tax=Hibiscus sabdariffa TaxID=183260 RepID=A0ABR2BN87_9ROSI
MRMKPKGEKGEAPKVTKPYTIFFGRARRQREISDSLFTELTLMICKMMGLQSKWCNINVDPEWYLNVSVILDMLWTGPIAPGHASHVMSMYPLLLSSLGEHAKLFPHNDYTLDTNHLSLAPLVVFGSQLKVLYEQPSI